MKFEVRYQHQKKKGYSKRSAMFYKVEDAIFWEKYIKETGAKEIEIVPH
jgi:hypothetical protein|tara:strand:+ start:3005 stop:3151 length:147 start_codon:yes stop_codon:yes gene_type:complete